MGRERATFTPPTSPPTWSCHPPPMAHFFSVCYFTNNKCMQSYRITNIISMYICMYVIYILQLFAEGKVKIGE